MMITEIFRIDVVAISLGVLALAVLLIARIRGEMIPRYLTLMIVVLMVNPVIQIISRHVPIEAAIGLSIASFIMTAALCVMVIRHLWSRRSTR